VVDGRCIRASKLGYEVAARFFISLDIETEER
jgi:hypothetical protein